MTPTQRKSGIRLPWSHDEDATGEADAAQAPEQSVAEEPMATDATAPGLAASTALGSAEAAAPPSAEPEHLEQPDSALLASLVTAMREVAEREREASLTGLRTATDEAVLHLRERSAEGADGLRQKAEADIAGIGDWVRAETERIGAEGERKVETRRQQLTQQLTDHEQRGQREVESLHARFDEYERELASFFAQLNEIDDPAAFGAAAKRMPRPPVVAVKPEPSSTPPTAAAPVAAHTADADGSTPAAPEATTAADATTTEPMTAEAPTAEASTAEPMTAEVPTAETATAEPSGPEAAAAELTAAVEVQGTAPEPATEAEPTAEEREAEMVETHRTRLDALGIGAGTSPEDDEAPVGEPEGAATDATTTGAEPVAYTDPLRARLAELDARLGPDEGEDREVSATPSSTAEVATAIVVHGLGSFGAITSFKQALERVEGVHGISLSLGPTGEFVYRATHDTGFDLVAAIEQIERGQAQVDRQPDGSLRVTVQRTR